MRRMRHWEGSSQSITSTHCCTPTDANEEERNARIQYRPMPSELYRIRMAHPRLLKAQFLRLVQVHYCSNLLSSAYPAFPSYPTIRILIRQSWRRAAVNIHPNGARLTMEEITKVRIPETLSGPGFIFKLMLLACGFIDCSLWRGDV